MSIQIGRVVLNESAIRPFDESWSADGRLVTLSGILFNNTTYSVARLTALHDDILNLPESLVPLILDEKTHRNGFYTVVGSKSSIVFLQSQNIIQLTWEVSLRREGAANEVDLEARLSGPANRLNDFTLSGNRWYAPSGNAQALYAGSASPSSVSRVSVGEGTIATYVSLAEATPAIRWYSAIADYGKGRARVISGGFERAGVGVNVDVNSCILQSTLVSVELKANSLTFSYYDGSTTFTKDVNLMVNSAALPRPLAASILFNEYDRVTLRCLWNVAGVGRVIGDLTLRRGSRFFEIILKSATATTLGVRRTVAEAGTAGSGFVRATANDTNGERYVVGSSKTFTNDLTNGGFSKASVVRLDAFVGVELNGTTAVTGDTGADLMAQYLGSPSSTVVAVRR